MKLVRYFIVLSALVLSPLAMSQERIKVGAMLPLTGELASFGEIILESIKRVDLKGIELVIENDECLPAKTVAAYKKLKDIDKVSYFLGPICGSPQQALAPLIKAEPTVAMLLGSGADNLYENSGGKIFSPQYSNEDEAKFNASVLHKLGAKRVALVFYDDSFCRNHEKAFRAFFPGHVVESFTYSTFDPSALKPMVAKIKSLKVDGLYVPDVSPFLLGLRRELLKLGMSDIPVVSISSAQSNDLLKAEGQAANGIRYSYPVVGEGDAFGHFATEGTKLLYDAIGACGKDTECVRNDLKQRSKFNERGILSGEIETRVIRDGKFVSESQRPTNQ
jgi:branched-chain amino acid transport system substrate-binding protein